MPAAAVGRRCAEANKAVIITAIRAAAQCRRRRHRQADGIGCRSVNFSPRFLGKKAMNCQSRRTLFAAVSAAVSG